ncbi:Major facilitator superfamily domain-containing protein 8 [Armadillidium vulgare]|nr:Major facilitator superfamily domain-containing protein 8 [Armadillidium vulgare]
MASSTTMQERTTKIAILSAAQSSGFILGPILQTIFTASIDGVKKYQATGWFAASLGIVNFILITPWIFKRKAYPKRYLSSLKECNIVEKEHHQKSAQTSTSETSSSSSKPDLYSIAGLLTSYFFSMMIFVFMETLAVPLLTDQYAWGSDKAIIVVGVLTVCTGFVAIFMVFILKKFLYKYDDRKIVLFLGLVPILLGTFFYMPIYTNIPIPRSNCTENGGTESFLAMYSYFVKLPTEGYHQPILSSTSDDQSTNQNCTAGCPIDQTWCDDVSQIPLAQFLSANILIVIGFPISSAIIIGVYSKTVGNRPQGMWMAFLSEVLCVARIVGPVFASYVYTRYGTIVSFASITIGMIIGIISFILIMKRLPNTATEND